MMIEMSSSLASTPWEAFGERESTSNVDVFIAICSARNPERWAMAGRRVTCFRRHARRPFVLQCLLRPPRLNRPSYRPGFPPGHRD